MTVTDATADEILEFWFRKLGFKDWFSRSDELDREMSERYSAIHLALSRHRPEHWLGDAQKLLALILVFDQFPRNIYRGSPLAFATDGLGIALAKHLVAGGLDKAVAEEQRVFVYLPFEHQENMADQDESVRLCATLADPRYLDYAERHRDVIRRFGRFPHRNAILMRPSTPEELDYLAQPGVGF